jgi:ATP-dependent DNA ligase
MADRNDSVENASAHFIEPMLCLAVSALPEGSQWEYELKLDGYRAVGLKTHSRTVLLSRNGKDFTRRFQPVACALEALPDETVIDGEVVALDETDDHRSTCYRTTPRVNTRWSSMRSMCRFSLARF